MDKRVNDFLSKHRLCTLAVLLSDGAPHAATLYYSHRTNPLELYAMTENNSIKVQALRDRKSVKASFVTGFSEEEWITLQMDGEVRVASSKKELAKIHKIHFEKHKDPEKYKNDPGTVFLVFKPTWWRYTEYKPNFLVISSEKNGSKE